MGGLLTEHEQTGAAEKIIHRYVDLPFPVDDRSGDARSARFEVLGELRHVPDGAVSAVRKLGPELADRRQYAELVGILADHVHTHESAEFLSQLLDSVDASIRRKAIHGLRMMSRRTDRIGGRRRIVKDNIEPRVGDLVPQLVKGARDEDESNRVTALYALADARAPEATAELRRRLEDSSRRVRLYAACFLTECKDASGLPQMRNGLSRLCETKPTDDVRYYGDAEMLLASFERITGKSFGDIPMNPSLCSDLQVMARYEREYAALLDAWSRWWDWKPNAENSQPTAPSPAPSSTW
jgi:hypothetical protein